MVTDEEMKFREALKRLATSPLDMERLLQLAPRYQGTNFESYPERYIPKKSAITMGDPRKETQRFRSLGYPNDFLLEAMAYNPYGGTQTGLDKAYIKDPFQGLTVPHELEHVAQHQARPDWESKMVIQKLIQAIDMAKDIGESKRISSSNSNELWANLSALEANAPVGSDWQGQIPWKRSKVTKDDAIYYDTKRRPDLDQPLGPLPRPDVKQWGYSGAEPTLLERLLKWWNK